MSSTETSNYACLACDTQGSLEPFLQGCRDLYVGTGFVVDYYRCEVCGLVQQFPRPKDPGLFYKDYPIHQSRSAPHAAASESVMRNVYFRPNIPRADSILLDFGCGDGSYLASVKSLFARVYGYEMSGANAANISERIGIPVLSDLRGEAAGNLSGTIDIVTMHFVLEHVTDLHAAFDSVQRLLKPGGMFYFVVPNVASWEFALFRRHWHGLDPPRHISFPDRRSVGLLANRHHMKIVRAKYVAFPNGVAGSISTSVIGTFKYPLFLAALPLGMIASRVAPQGTLAFWLEKPLPH